MVCPKFHAFNEISHKKYTKGEIYIWNQIEKKIKTNILKYTKNKLLFKMLKTNV